jgi:tetratricopeptide (TPR) repeat protein
MSGYIDRRQGRWEQSLEEMNKALELDPHNFSILQQISLTYEGLRRYKEMAVTLDSALAIAPKDVPGRVRRAWVDLESRQNSKPLHATIEQSWARPSAAPVLVHSWLDVVFRDSAIPLLPCGR